MKKSNVLNLIFLIAVLSVIFVISPKQQVDAALPGSVDGTVKAKLPDGTTVNLPGVKIARTDYVGSGWSINGVVEVITNNLGYYYMGNNLPEPNYVKRCDVENGGDNPHANNGAHLCLSGEKGKIPAIDDGRSCLGYNWCGLNCGSNPHKIEPYFPKGYTLPGNLGAGYKISEGQWQPAFIQGDWNNNQPKHDHNFVFLLTALTPTITPTVPHPPTFTPTPPKIQCGDPCFGPPNQIDNQCVKDCPVCLPGPNPLQKTCSKIPCGSPCTGPANQIDEQCEQRCPICAPGPDPLQKICQAIVTPTATPTATLTPTPTPKCGDRCIIPRDCPQDCPYCEGPVGNKVCVGPSVTPTPVVNCQCDSITYTGEFGPGKTVNFNIITKVINPDTYLAKVLDVIVHVQQNGVEITSTNPPIIPAKVDAVYKERKTVVGEGGVAVVADYYTSSWSYKFPTNLTGINYFRIYADPATDIHCGWRTSQQNQKDQKVMVLSVNTGNLNFLQRILNTLNNLFTGGGGTLQLQSVPTTVPTQPPTTTPIPNVTTSVPGGVRSLQLGTFNQVVKVESGCSEMKIWIDYDWAPAPTPR